MSCAISCPACSKSVSADAEGRLPPWCRHCGASFKAGPETSAALAPAAPAHPGEPAQPVTGDCHPPRLLRPGPLFIHGCEPSMRGLEHTLHRIYITGTDLLFFRIGSGAVSGGQIVPRTKVRRALAGGLVGAIAMMREAENTRLAARVQELDQADELTLRHYAAEWPKSFIAAPYDLQWVRIDPPSGWVRFFSGIAHAGVLKVEHHTAGKMSLVVPSVRDVRLAAQELPKLFAGCVEINLPWASAAGRSAREPSTVQS